MTTGLKLISTEALFRFTQTSYSEREDLGPLTGGIILDTTGLLEEEVRVIVRTVATGTATCKLYNRYIMYTLPIRKFFSGANFRYIRRWTKPPEMKFNGENTCNWSYYVVVFLLFCFFNARIQQI